MRVKICGITNPDDATLCEDMGADALGFVHIPGRGRSLPLVEISEIISCVGPLTSKVLICSPREVDEAIRMIDRSGADALQLYSLSVSQLRELRDSGTKVMRVVPPVREEAMRFTGDVDALVFEGGTPGTGSSYDYTKVPVDCSGRSIIAGGLNLDNIEIAKSMRPYALDVSSGVERSFGKKDPDLVSEFIRRCHL